MRQQEMLSFHFYRSKMVQCKLHGPHTLAAAWGPLHPIHTLVGSCAGRGDATRDESHGFQLSTDGQVKIECKSKKVMSILSVNFMFASCIYIYGLAAHHLGLWHFELPTVIVSMASQKGGMAASGPAGQWGSSWFHKVYYNLGKCTIIFSNPSKCTIKSATGQSALLKGYTVGFQGSQKVKLVGGS